MDLKLLACTLAEQQSGSKKASTTKKQQRNIARYQQRPLQQITHWKKRTNATRNNVHSTGRLVLKLQRKKNRGFPAQIRAIRCGH